MNAGAVRRSTQSPAITPALNPFFGLLPQELWGSAKDFFIYGVDFNPIAASVTVTQDIAIESDSDFLIVAGVRTVTTQADQTTVVAFPPFLVEIFDQGSGRRLQNRAQHIENVFGTAQLPAYWPFPKLIPRASTVSTTIQNLTATAHIIRLSYLGFKIFGGM